MSFTSGAYASHAQQVLREDQEGTPANTLKAYEAKATEFLQYCKLNHKSNDMAIPATTVTEEKVFGFLYYQSCREVYKRGKNVKMLDLTKKTT